MRIFLSLVAALSFMTHAAQATSLTSLIGGATITEQDVLFGGFAFTDNNVPSIPGDFVPNTDNITVTSSSDATNVYLDFTLDPAAALTADFSFFEFLVDFNATVVAPSARQITSLGLSTPDADMSIAGDATVGAEFVDAISNPSVIAAIFDDTLIGRQISDSAGVAGTGALSLFGKVGGQLFDGNSSASISSFRLTFGLDRELTPPPAVPLPAGLPLLASAFAMGAFVLRRKKS